MRRNNYYFSLILFFSNILWCIIMVIDIESLPVPPVVVPLVCPCYTLDDGYHECRCYSYNPHNCSQTVTDGWSCIQSECKRWIFPLYVQRQSPNGTSQPSGIPLKHIEICWKCVKLVLLMQQCLEPRTVSKQGIWGHQIKSYWSWHTSVDCPIHLTFSTVLLYSVFVKCVCVQPPPR